MATCEPIMVLLTDLLVIDELAKKRTDSNLYERENRKELIQLRKEVIHELITYGLPFME